MYAGSGLFILCLNCLFFSVLLAEILCTKRGLRVENRRYLRLILDKML